MQDRQCRKEQIDPLAVPGRACGFCSAVKRLAGSDERNRHRLNRLCPGLDDPGKSADEFHLL
jgi:hypothetical protein